MKSFLEEYGFSILAAIVVILLIVMATPVGSNVREQISNITRSLSSNTAHKIQSENGDLTIKLTNEPSLSIMSKSSTDKFDYIVHYVENGEEKETERKSYEEGFQLGCTPDGKSELYVEVINLGTDKHYFSNIIVIPSESLPAVSIPLNTIIQLEGKNYVVLENKGNSHHLVMSIDGIAGKLFNVDQNNQNKNLCKWATLADGGSTYETCNNQYENSNIDLDLNNNYYNGLSQKLKDAIVEQNIQQKFYKYNSYRENEYRWVNKEDISSFNYCYGWCVKQSNGEWISWDKHKPTKGQIGAYDFANGSYKRNDNYRSNVIKRKVFLPSVDEISNIVNVNDQWEMDKFLRNSSGIFVNMMFRDGLKQKEHSLYGTASCRSLEPHHVSATWFAVRPAFVVDLSKIDFVNTENTFM